MTTEQPPHPADMPLTDRCASSGEFLAGLIAAGMLEHVATPTKLPSALFPDTDPELVNRIWNTALPVGYRAGLIAAAPRWTREDLQRLGAALREAGYQGMARLTDRSAHTLPATRMSRADGTQSAQEEP
ncbi:hypothetical protein [Streptomyces sp. NPDC059076]|uniref:hypothetical protein n=1 Tax=unclassified Streptomyces TaxID=2593676 RepID=UPI0036C30E5B